MAVLKVKTRCDTSDNVCQAHSIKLENTQGVIKNRQSRETGNIWYGTQDEEKQNKKYNTMCHCVGNHYMQNKHK